MVCIWSLWCREWQKQLRSRKPSLVSACARIIASTYLLEFSCFYCVNVSYLLVDIWLPFMLVCVGFILKDVKWLEQGDQKFVCCNRVHSFLLEFFSDRTCQFVLELCQGWALCVRMWTAAKSFFFVVLRVITLWSGHMKHALGVFLTWYQPDRTLDNPECIPELRWGYHDKSD